MTAKRRHWWPAYIGIGSNLESPQQQVESAIETIGKLETCHLALRSSLYRSAPMCGADQPDYINAVVAILTSDDPFALLDLMQGIESDHGRVRDGQRWGSRTLDLDLLVFGQSKINEPQLTVPHTGIAARNFVLLPFAEIAPDVVVPGLGSVSTLAQKFSEPVPPIEKLAR